MRHTSFDPRRLIHLESQLARCEALSRRYSWGRAVVVFAGGGAAWGAANSLGVNAGWAVLGVALSLFVILVYLHRRIDYTSSGFRILLAIYRDRDARKSLDWQNIPNPAAGILADFSPMALDLDLTGPRSLHHLLDTTISRQGSLLLANWLTVGTPSPEQIQARQAVVAELAGLPRFRTRLTLLFRRLSSEPLDGELLLRWLRSPNPQERLRQVLPWAACLSILNIFLVGLWLLGWLSPIWLLSALAYGIVFFSSRSWIEEFLADIVRLDRELSKFRPLLEYLERFPYGSRTHLFIQCQPFCAGPNLPSRSLRQVQIVTTFVGLRTNQILGPILNILFAWDFWAAWLSARQRQKMADLLPGWLAAFHELEALLALAEYACLHPENAFPKVRHGTASLNHAAGPVLSARRLGHPLLSPGKKVCNDIQIGALGDLWIVTGSNMAGKSTFIRTLGINLCLAYAGGPVDAAELDTDPFRLYTCIRISDSLGEGYSYFYAEVKRLKGLLDSIQPHNSSAPLLYLVDEIFRGTNNRERLIGSRSFVQALIGASGVGLIATHDLELAALADENHQVHNFHFRDQVDDGRLTFDYRLRPGPSPTTNALIIMALEGLPVDRV